MDTWDSRYPFTPEEANIFSRLHQKATKFPAPLGIKIDLERSENENKTKIQSLSLDKDFEVIFEDEQTKQ